MRLHATRCVVTGIIRMKGIIKVVTHFRIYIVESETKTKICRCGAAEEPGSTNTGYQ